MALSVAIPLSGLELEQFNNLAHHLMMNKIDFKINMQRDARSSSPSTKSDSSCTSGISSLVPCSNYTTPPSSSPISSRSETPTKDKESSDGSTNDIEAATTDGISRQSQKRPSPSIAGLATDLCELNQFYRQLLQLPASQLYRPVGKSRRRLVKLQKVKPPLKIIYRERDILNLEANLREPSWQMRTPAVPKHNIRYFMANRSVYYRLGDHGLTEEYPMRICKDCNFNEPSPFLF